MSKKRSETRREKKNVIEFINENVVRKISKLKENNRLQRLKVEAWVLSQVRRRGINVPRVLDYYLDLNDQEVLVLERIHGQPLSLNPPKEKRGSMLQIGPQMMQLANIVPNYGWIDPISMTGSSESWRIFISGYAQTYGERLFNSGILSREDLSMIYESIQNTDIEIPEPYLLNRDFRLSHFLRDNSGKIWILDWENAILGDPLYDLAIFAARYGEGDLWQHLREGYDFDYLPPKYSLYKTISLIGIIDYCRKNKIDYHGRIRKLARLISLLKGS